MFGLHVPHKMLPTGRALELVSVCCLGSAQLLYGYDQGVLSGFVDTEPFRASFGYPSNTMTGLITSVYNLGCLAGALVGFVVGDVIGRRRTIMLGCLIIIVGGILQSTSYGIPQMIVGRIITGLGTGLNTTTVPVLQSEISLSARRGQLVMIETSITIAGVALATWTDYGIIYGGDIFADNQWRTGLALQCVFPVIVFALIGFVPESPRWLARKGRMDEIAAILARLHGKGAVAEDPRIQLEARIIRETAEHEANIATGWRELFKKSELQSGRRILLAGYGQVINQLCGINLLTYYAPLIFRRSLQFDQNMAHVLGGVGNTIQWLGTLLPIFLVEYGRRKLMMCGLTVMSISMAMLAVSTSIVESSSGFERIQAGWASAAMIYTYYFAFGAANNSIPWLWAPELSTLRTRQQAAAFATANNWLWNFVVVQVTPDGVANIGYQYYIVWAVSNAFFVLCVYLFYPETSGRSLEDMDDLFLNNQGWIIKKEYRKRVKGNKAAEHEHNVVLAASLGDKAQSSQPRHLEGDAKDKE